MASVLSQVGLCLVRAGQDKNILTGSSLSLPSMKANSEERPSRRVGSAARFGGPPPRAVPHHSPPACPSSARSTITFKPGKTPLCGFICIEWSTSRPVVIPDGQLSIGGDHGWSIGQDDRAWWCSWFLCAQACKGTQTPHLGRHTRPTGCQPCRTG
jgi:hypothetical protein